MYRILTVAVATLLLSACATKEFEEMPPLDAGKLRAMSCDDIEQEFLLLQRHERGVDEEATSGQAKQISGAVSGRSWPTRSWSTSRGRRYAIGNGNSTRPG